MGVFRAGSLLLLQPFFEGGFEAGGDDTGEVERLLRKRLLVGVDAVTDPSAVSVVAD